MSPSVSGGGSGAGGLVSLFSSVLGASAASFDTGANGISANHGVLHIYGLFRTDEAVVTSNPLLRFNNDSGANYDRIYATNVNTTVTGGNSLAQTSFLIDAAGSSRASNYFAPFELRIPQYDATTAFKTGHVINGVPDSTAANTIWLSQVYTWKSTAAITRISITTATGNFIAGSSLQIFGTA